MVSTKLAIGSALSAGAGAWLASEDWLLGLFVLAAVVVRKIALLFVVSVGVVTSLLSAHAWEQLERPLPRDVSAVGVVTSDPERSFGSLRLEIDVDGRRYQAIISPEHTNAVRDVAVGDRLYASGTVEELSGKAAPSLRRKHVAGRLHLDEIRVVERAGGLFGVANQLRALVVRGAAPMEPENRALYRGLVMGDDRDQSESQREEFRDAGIAHLLAVSGQNVAFLLLVLAPALALCGRRTRVFVAVGALVVFGAVTRWEPSVVRAVVMAAVVLFAHLKGHKFDAWRALGVATTVSLVIDPFLIGSIGFLLSVSACAGMAGFAGPIAARLPGPRWLTTGLAVTMAAQVGVAPVQLSVFGPMAVVALASNAAAAPLAAFVMMWGMTAGLIAGVTGGPVAVLVSWPAELAVSLLADVASTAARHSGLGWGLWSALVMLGALISLPDRSRRSGDQEVASPP